MYIFVLVELTEVKCLITVSRFNILQNNLKISKSIKCIWIIKFSNKYPNVNNICINDSL